jgi:hypothetical protein
LSLVDSVKKISYNNDVFLELGGGTGVYSLNYQRKLVQAGNFNLKARLGFSAISFPNLGVDYWIVFGGSMGYNISKRSSFVLGGGQIYYSGNVFDFFEKTGQKKVTEYYTYFDLGFRYSFSKQWFCKASYTPVILYNEPNEAGVVFDHWGGISVGHSF